MKKFLLSLISMVAAPCAMAQAQSWQATWDETLAAAKKEGKVVVVGSPDPVMRQEIIPRFTKRFGISVEFIAGSSGQMVTRVRTERFSGIYSVDIFMAGAATTVNALYAEKMLAPLQPLLVLPEVTDGAKWKRGKPWFIDPEEQYILLLFSRIDGLMFINTAYVPPQDMRAARDLLNPKWKGRIASEDPTATGSGSNKSVQLYNQLGLDFIKHLYVDQKPAISRDRRQLTDWLARGTYPICLTCRADDARDLQNEGFKLLEIFELSDVESRVVSAPFLLSVANKAPHLNAARIFANWLAGREPLEIYSRNYESATLRTDVEESFLDPRTIPRPGVRYGDDTEFNWVASGRRETAEKVRELLKKP